MRFVPGPFSTDIVRPAPPGATRESWVMTQRWQATPTGGSIGANAVSGRPAAKTSTQTGSGVPGSFVALFMPRHEETDRNTNLKRITHQ